MESITFITYANVPSTFSSKTEFKEAVLYNVGKTPTSIPLRKLQETFICLLMPWESGPCMYFDVTLARLSILTMSMCLTIS